MKRRILTALLCCLMIVAIIPMYASADMGPKPSVTVTIEGVPEGTRYYATLLSNEESNGPLRAYALNRDDPTPYDEDPEQYEILQHFAQYSDSDGYFFLPQFWECEGNDSFSWTYYPPDSFKILLYFPDRDSFTVSKIYEVYAFDSYYTVNLENNPIPVTAVSSYDHSDEVVSLVARLLLTVAIELVIALFFRFHEKKQLLLIGGVNIVTQLLLHLSLNVAYYYNGSQQAVLVYVLAELLVCICEGALYAKLIPKVSRKPATAGRAIGYALTANAVSFAAGLGLAYLIPGLF